ncbi:MAG: hypothetical protein CMJ58_06335 [Planctomycetaceae bacterium]|jgi:hypothetical protein|nr:hypothetical protein [Planctomycetaceae bacterium]
MERTVLFWGACIPARSLVAYHAKDNPVIRVGAAVVSARWLLGMEQGTVGFFGGRVWWRDARALHGALWGAYAVTGRPLYLWTDMVFGASNWLLHYFAGVIG